MGAVALVFVAAIVLAVGLVLVVRIPAFESRRVRLVTLIVIAGVLVVGTAAGSIWALATIDGAVDQRVDVLRPVLSRSTSDPERLYGGRAARSLPGDSEVFPELPTGRAVIVLSEVSRWWVRHCVRARVTRTGVSITTTDRPCHR